MILRLSCLGSTPNMSDVERKTTFVLCSESMTEVKMADFPLWSESMGIQLVKYCLKVNKCHTKIPVTRKYKISFIVFTILYLIWWNKSLMFSALFSSFLEHFRWLFTSWIRIQEVSHNADPDQHHWFPRFNAPVTSNFQCDNCRESRAWERMVEEADKIREGLVAYYNNLLK